MSGALNGSSVLSLLNRLKEAIWYRTPEGRVLFVNSAVEEVYGVAASEVREDASAFMRHIPPEERDRVRAAGRAAAREPRELEYEVRVPGREPRWVRARLGPLHDEEGRVVAIAGMAEDITAEVWSRRRGAEMENIRSQRDAAREAEEALREILERITDGFFALDRDWRFRYVNGRFEQILGKGSDEVLERIVFDVFPEFRDTVFHHRYAEALREDRTVEFTAYYDPLNAWYEVHAYPSAKGLSIFFRDVTEQRRLEMELAEATARERQRVGAELHDSVGQGLTGASLLIRTLEARAAAGERVDPADVRAIGVLVQDLIADIRRISRGLFPAELVNDGLPAALEALAAEVEELFAIACHVRASPAIELSSQAELHLLRIAQEAITNAVKHAEPSEVLVELQSTSRGIELAVTHDGSTRGDAGVDRPGLGVRSMAYRAQAVGGAIRTASTPDGRTRTTCLLPS